MTRRRFWIILAPFLVLAAVAVVWDVQWRLRGRPDEWPTAKGHTAAATEGGGGFRDSNLPFVASGKSGTYHRRDCASAKKIAPGNLVTFPTTAAAEGAGLRPCRICHPGRQAAAGKP